MSNLDEIRAVLRCEALIQGVDMIRNGHVRIETTFRYPDGGSIELFVVNDPATPLLPPTVLSDLGQTTAWLLDMQIKPWLSKKRQAFVDDVLHVAGARQNGGALEINFDPARMDHDLESKVVVLAQACLRIADLTFTRRASLQTSFSEEVEEVLVDGDLSYEPNAELLGRFAPVRVDYLVHGGRDSAVMGWASGNASQAHTVSNEIFRRWYDLAERPEQRVTLFDDRYDVYRAEDMKRLSNYSEVIALSERRAVVELLAA